MQDVSAYTYHRDPNDGGLLSSLITELEFNHIVSNVKGCLFEAYQFESAISDGILSLLEKSLRDTIMSTYAHIRLANQAMKDLGKLHPTDGSDLVEIVPAACDVAETIFKLESEGLRALSGINKLANNKAAQQQQKISQN